MAFDAKRVINGTYGEIWLDGELLGECFALQAKVTITKADVIMCGKASKSQKMVGWEGKGTLKLNKVNSRMINKLGNNIKLGKQTTCTIISKLADPDSFGTERVVLKGVSFDDLTLVDWEAKKNAQNDCPFTFEDYDFIDLIAN